MDKKELLKDLYSFLKKHNAYMRTEEDYISIIRDDTDEQLQVFFYMVDNVEIKYRLRDMGVEVE